MERRRLSPLNLPPLESVIESQQKVVEPSFESSHRIMGSSYLHETSYSGSSMVSPQHPGLSLGCNRIQEPPPYECYHGNNSNYFEQTFSPIDQHSHPTVSYNQWSQYNNSTSALTTFPSYMTYPATSAPSFPTQHTFNPPQYDWQRDPNPCLPAHSLEFSPKTTLKSNRGVFNKHRPHPFLTPESSGYSSMTNSGMNTPTKCSSQVVSVEALELAKARDARRKEKNKLCDQRRRDEENEETACLEKENPRLKQGDEEVKKRSQRERNKLSKQKSRNGKKEKRQKLRDENAYLKQELEKEREDRRKKEEEVARLEKENTRLIQERALSRAKIQELTKELEKRRIKELKKNLNEAAEITEKHQTMALSLIEEACAELAKEE